ncbi:hypothetical protein HK101_008875 [Irineochytrium annulatum]|nr:hypothetical protein HK101_008875 [Irineochytrium annulatum]
MSTSVSMPPVAKKVPHTHVYHGVAMEPVDQYHWLKDRNDTKHPDVIAYLEAENSYCKAVHIDPNAKLIDEVYGEFLSRINEDDTEAPVFVEPYWYYTKTVKGLQYSVYCRRLGSMDAQEEEYLDINKLKNEYMELGSVKVSPDHKTLAYALDTAGDEYYHLYIQNLSSGDVTDLGVTDAAGSIAWDANSTVIFYSILDKIHRSYAVKRHVVASGASSAADVVVYSEPDEKFEVGFFKSNSGKYIFISASSSLTTEYHYVVAERPEEECRLFCERELNHKYSVEHQGDNFVILTDGGRKFLNFKLQKTPLGKTSREFWTDIIPYDPLRNLEDFVVFDKFIAVMERSGGLERIRIVMKDQPASTYLLDFPEEIFNATCAGLSTQNYKADVSPLQPKQTWTYNVSTKSRTLLKEVEIPGGFDKSLYTTKIVFAPIPPATRVPAPGNTPIPDGIPILLAYRKDTFRTREEGGNNRTWLYAYGSYGISINPIFSSARVSFWDRGIVTATALVRGGGENGRGWYETGKFLHKMNTFTDFIAAADYLVESGVTKHELMCIEGRSAGGLLIGSVLNLRPNVAAAAVAGVPFVDVISTMMDETIPLTVNEYEEWGSPKDKTYFDYMMSYSPYDNVKRGVKFPNLLIKAGLNDPRVSYWEPAKWCAKLREFEVDGGKDDPDRHVIVFDCKMGSGHFGASGRYGYLKEVAADYAFVITQLDKAAKKLEAILKAIAYTAYGASDEIISVNDDSAATASASASASLFSAWIDQSVKNDKETLPSHVHLRAARELDPHLARSATKTDGAAESRHRSILIHSGSLVMAVPSLYRIADSTTATSSTVIHASLPSFAATSASLPLVSGVSPLAVVLVAESEPQEARDLSLAVHGGIAGAPALILASEARDRFVKLHARKKNPNFHPNHDASKDLAASFRDSLHAYSLAKYDCFEYTGSSTASHVLVILGTLPRSVEEAVTTVTRPAGLGVVRVRLYRPWSARDLVAVIPTSAKTIAILECVEQSAETVGAKLGNFGPLFIDVAGSFQAAERADPPTLKEVRIALKTGQGLSVPLVKKVLEQVEHNTDADPHIHVDGTPFASAEEVNSYFFRCRFPTSLTCVMSFQSASASVGIPLAVSTTEPDVEAPYLSLLNQLFKNRLNIANVIDSDSVLLPPSGEGSLKDGTSAEFGLGLHLAQIQDRSRFVDEVRSAIASAKLPPTLAQTLNAWLSAAHTHEELVKGKEALSSLETFTANAIASSLLAKGASRHLAQPSPSRWLIGGDRLAYDIGTSGVHHVIASKADVNILILDTQPYSEKKSPARTDLRKKDVGLYAMTYGGCYVASVALQSSYSGVVRALQEADSHRGPSVVVAYAPRVTVGRGGVVKGGGGVAATAALAALKETKLAVDEGYWPLYRFDPSKDEGGFHLDSGAMRDELKAFLERGSHLALVAKEAEAELTPMFEEEMRSGVEGKIRDSYAELVRNLNATPVLILYGSDGGVGASYAKRIGSEAKQRGLLPKIAVMDTFSIEQLNKHKLVIFVVSTAGQGEFPGNSRETWKVLNSPQGKELGIHSGLSYAVFALGDRHYWPLPADAHYFCKAGKDLDMKLNEIGATKLVDVGLGDDRDPDGPMTAYRAWSEDLWSALGVGGMEVADVGATAPSDDAIKVASNFLRGTIAEGLVDTSTGQLAELDTKITKFHGIYQQDDRDIRDARARAGLEKAFSFMIRVRVPGGVATPAQWLAMDEIADTHANGTIKITTRQTFQFHGIIKSKLKKSMQEINQSLMDTIAACGDVNRNVMCNPIPSISALHADVFDFTKRFSEHLLPHTNAYHEIWLDKKVVVTSEDHEPIYGKTYLPRKFKVAVAVPPHNDVDVFAHDLGYIAVTDKSDRLIGFNVSVGGGMGMTHGMNTTYPRLGTVIGFCTVDKAIEVGEKVVLVQRDHGDRTNRKHARLKYTIDDRGIDWFKGEVEKRLGYTLDPARPYHFESNGDRYGWIEGVGGKWNYTMFVQNGRVKDTIDRRYKAGLREIAKVHKGEFRLTPNQHVVIADVPRDQRSVIERIMAEHNIENGSLSGLRQNSMACVALPTCALAMAESERYLPDLVGRIEELLEQQGLREDAITIRMTGCPNGCARPQIAEIAFVGKAPGSYNMYLGGGFNGERLNKIFKESIGEEEILKSLAPIIKDYAASRVKGEHFGDFVIRKGYVKATREGKDFHDV